MIFIDKLGNFWYVMCGHLDSKQLMSLAWKAAGNLVFSRLVNGWRMQCSSREVVDDFALQPNKNVRKQL